MTIGSLFSGIGGLELGLERSGIGRVRWQCEIDPFRRSVLAKRFPGAFCYEDVRTVYVLSRRGDVDPVDVLCGGFPCQDVSQSARGRNDGLAGQKSGLWRYFAGVAEAIRPRRIVVENVASGKQRWLPQVRRDLHVLGYDTRAIWSDARDVGAPFAGARIFVVAAPYSDGESALSFNAEMARLSEIAGLGRHWRDSSPSALRMDDGVPRGLDRVRALGDAVVPQQAEMVGRLIRSTL